MNKHLHKTCKSKYWNAKKQSGPTDYRTADQDSFCIIIKDVLQPSAKHGILSATGTTDKINLTQAKSKQELHSMRKHGSVQRLARKPQFPQASVPGISSPAQNPSLVRRQCLRFALYLAQEARNRWATESQDAARDGSKTWRGAWGDRRTW